MIIEAQPVTSVAFFSFSFPSISPSPSSSSFCLFSSPSSFLLHLFSSPFSSPFFFWLFFFLHNIQLQDYGLASIFTFQLLGPAPCGQPLPSDATLPTFQLFSYLSLESNILKFTKCWSWAAWLFTQFNSWDWCSLSTHALSFISQLPLQLDGVLGWVWVHGNMNKVLYHFFFEVLIISPFFLSL